MADMLTENTNVDELEKELESSIPPMDARDRCDSCQSRSYVAVTLKSGGRLDFCKHHFDKHEKALLPIIVDMRDQREQLSAPKESTVHA